MGSLLQRDWGSLAEWTQLGAVLEWTTWALSWPH